MKKLILLSIIALLCCAASAQKTDNAIGLRAGFGGGITFQHYMSKNTALEFLGYSRFRGVVLTALYEIHEEASGVRNLYWYYGGGGHIGSYRYYADGPWKNSTWTGSQLTAGVDGILGLEYFIQDIPFMLSVDWKPSFDFVGFSHFWGDEGAISVRYTFN